jgi:ParB/RepB/Spo0J family partition protein
MSFSQSTQVSIDSVWVNRDERQRRELTGLEELLASMNQIGQINPIIIERSGELKAGERRWTAAKLGGWSHIEARYVDELDEVELQELELEENIKREQLEWKDECAAVAKYHALQLGRDPKWTIERTAERLGMSRRAVGDKLGVAREIAGGNERVATAPKLSVAVGVVSRVNQRAQASASQAIIAAALPQVAAKAEETARAVPLIQADFNQWALEYSGEKFNFLHCDFPYGVDADKHDQGQAAAMGGYADSFEVYEQLLSTLKTAMLNDNLVDQSAHLMFWFSMDYYQYTFEVLREMGWDVNPFPLIWYKSDNTGVLPDYRRGPRRGYETAFMASRGDRLLTAKGAVNNVCAYPGRDKSIHMSEKPVPMLKHFMGMMVDSYTTMLDPTAGSANSLKAAQGLGARSVLGLEANEEFYNRAKEAYHGSSTDN